MWVLIVSLTCVSPLSVSAGVGDNVGSSSLELAIGSPEATDEPTTVFGWFRKIWIEVSRIGDVAAKVDRMSDKLDSVKLDVGISASQTYLTMLNDYQTNGTSSSVYNDKTQWDALCRSSVMHCSQKFSGEALDYYITNNLSLEQFFKDMNYTDATIRTVDDIVANYSTIKNNSLCLYSLCNSQCSLRAFYSATSSTKNNFYDQSNRNYFLSASRLLTTYYFPSYSCNGSCYYKTQIIPMSLILTVSYNSTNSENGSSVVGWGLSDTIGYAVNYPYAGSRAVNYTVIVIPL